MSTKEEHPSNTGAPKVLTLAGIVTLVKAELLENA